MNKDWPLPVVEGSLNPCSSADQLGWPTSGIGRVPGVKHGLDQLIGLCRSPSGQGRSDPLPLPLGSLHRMRMRIRRSSVIVE